MAHPLHPDAAAILARLQRERVSTLYHFTSVENLPSICEQQGLCSKQTLEKERKWPLLRYLSNEWRQGYDSTESL